MTTFLGCNLCPEFNNGGFVLGMVLKIQVIKLNALMLFIYIYIKSKYGFLELIELLLVSFSIFANSCEI